MDSLTGELLARETCCENDHSSTFISLASEQRVEKCSIASLPSLFCAMIAFSFSGSPAPGVNPYYLGLQGGRVTVLPQRI